MGKCEHPDDKCKSAWGYEGNKLKGASGYCTVCGQEFVLDRKTGMLIPGNQKLSAALEAVEAARRRPMWGKNERS